MNGLYWCPALLMQYRRQSSGGGMGFFLVLVILGIIVFLVLRGRQDRAEQVGAPIRSMGSGPLAGSTFVNPYPKCPTCGAAGEKMKQAWDGLRKVTWSCGYCGSVAGIQELKDEELPPSARTRLGLDPPQSQYSGQAGYYPPQGGGAGELITGMMLGSMLGGERRNDDRWGGGPASGGDWGGNDPAAGGGDWNDAGSGDSGGGDSGGGDSGGGGDF